MSVSVLRPPPQKKRPNKETQNNGMGFKVKKLFSHLTSELLYNSET